MKGGVELAGVEAAVAALTSSRGGGWANPHLRDLGRDEALMASVFLCAVSKALLDVIERIALPFDADRFVQDLALAMQMHDFGGVS